MRREQLENMVSVTELANKASQIVSKAQAGKTQIVMRHNKPAAVLMDVELYLAIAELSNVWHKDLDEGEWTDIIDYAQTVVTVRRADANDDGTRYTFDELLAEMNISRGGPRLRLILRPEYRQMLLSLDPSEGQIVTRAMRRIERAPEAIGKPLRGGLSMCRSVRTGHNSRLRIVYRPFDDAAELIAVGQREGRVVYIIALEIVEN